MAHQAGSLRTDPDTDHRWLRPSRRCRDDTAFVAELTSAPAAALAHSQATRLIRFKIATLVIGLAATLGGSAFLVHRLLFHQLGPEPDRDQLTASAQTGQYAAKRDLFGDPLPDGAIARFGTTRFRHGGGNVVTVAPTRDGKLLISTNFYGDPEVCVWELPTGRPRYRFPGNVEFVQVSASPDDKLLAIPRGKEIHLWDLSTGRHFRHWSAHEHGKRYLFPPITSVAFSPDGKLLASAGMDEQNGLWDATTWEETRRFASGLPDGMPPELLVFSPDSRTLACAARLYNRVTLWDVTSGRKLHQLDGAGVTWSLAFSPDGQRLASGGRGMISVWDVRSGRRSSYTPAGGGFFGAIAYSPRGDLLAVAQSGQPDFRTRLVLLDGKTGQELRRAEASEAIDSLTFLRDGKTVAAGGNDGVIRLWDTDRVAQISVTGAILSAVASVALSPTGDLVYAATRRTMQGTADDVALNDTRTGKEVARLRGSGPMALSPDGHILAFWGDEDGVMIWDTRSRTVVKSLTGGQPAHRNGQFSLVTALSFALSGRLLAVASARDQVVGTDVWDVEAVKVLRHFPSKGGLVDALALSPDGSILVAGNGMVGGKVDVWDVGSGHSLHRLADPIGLALMEAGGALPTNPRVPSLGGPGLAFSPDGRLLAVAAAKRRTVDVWEVLSGKRRLQLKGHTENPMCVAFSPDGRFLASAAWDDTVRVWDAFTGEQRRCFRGHHGIVNSMSFFSDGRLLATGGADTTCLIWDLRSLPRGMVAAHPAATAGYEKLWTALSDPDASRAQQAIAELICGRDATVAFLTNRLRPPAPLDEHLVNRLVADLNSPQFAARERATTELRRFGEDVLPQLRQAVAAANGTSDFSTRVGNLIDSLSNPSNERLREYRALEILEWIGTPAAQTLLKIIAHGAATSRIAREAAASMQRLSGRSSGAR